MSTNQGERQVSDFTAGADAALKTAISLLSELAVRVQKADNPERTFPLGDPPARRTARRPRPVPGEPR